nr:IPT/TIG domain-containing protein [Caldimonas brevitalea]
MTMTVNGELDGPLYVKVSHAGSAVADVRDPTYPTDSSATILVVPENPSTLGAGHFTGTVTVTACVKDPTCATGQLVGSPKTLPVSYEIKPSVQSDTVMPYLTTAGSAGKVVIRGKGFSAAGIDTVSFGTTSATAFNIVSDSEIHATHSGLAAGRHTVTLKAGGSLVPFDGTLVAVPSVAYPASLLPYGGTLTETRGLLYDAERRVLFVAAVGITPEFNTLMRFPLSTYGTSVPSGSGVPRLRDIALTPDGTRLLVLTDDALMQKDPVTLTTLVTTPAAQPFSQGFQHLRELEVTNEGFALVTSGVYGSGFADLCLYSINDAAFYLTPDLLVTQASVGASADGSSLVIAHPTVYYDASTGRIARARHGLADHGHSWYDATVKPAVSRSGHRVVMTGRDYAGNAHTTVYDASLANVLGHLPTASASNSEASSGIAIQPDGSRAYVFDRAAMAIRTFDLTGAPVAGFYPEVLPARAVPAGLGSSLTYRMLVSPDGTTLFIGGTGAAAMMPAP